jgi:hypothetical protein
MFVRSIENELEEWASGAYRKPLVLRGARQVGKTTIVNKFGETFDNYLYVNGIFKGSVDFDPSNLTYLVSSANLSFFCAKYTENGDLVWVRTFDIDDLAGFWNPRVQNHWYDFPFRSTTWFGRWNCIGEFIKRE